MLKSPVATVDHVVIQLVCVCAYAQTSLHASLHMFSLTHLLFSAKLFINKATVFFLLKLSGLVIARDLITI